MRQQSIVLCTVAAPSVLKANDNPIPLLTLHLARLLQTGKCLPRQHAADAERKAKLSKPHEYEFASSI